MHITRIVREMVPPRYTITEAAKMVGVSVSTLKRWRRDEDFIPKESRQFGQYKVDLYRPEDIPVLQQIKKTKHPGRKKKNGDSEAVAEGEEDR